MSASDRTRNHSASVSKRRKLGNKDDAAHHDVKSGNQNSSVQTRVSESLRVTKPRHISAANPKVLPDELDSSDTAPEDIAARPSIESGRRTSGTTSQRSVRPTAELKSTEARVKNVVEVISYPCTFEDDPLTPTHADEVEREFDVSDQLGHVTSLGRSIFDDNGEEFDDDLNDDEFLEMTCHVADLSGEPTILPSSPRHSGSTRTIHVTEDISSPATKLPASPEIDHGNGQRILSKFVSPMTLTSRLLASTGDIDCADARKPIARPPFPEAVHDRSPIIGLSSDTLLRTCFRVGEAINQAHQASKNGKHIVLELYARILDSSRDDTKQHFTFCDLFHGKPPHIKGVYDGAVWQSVQLFDYDSKRLLQQGRICRCMGMMKRDGKEWVMSVSSIWEATWDDIKWVQGIIDA